MHRYSPKSSCAEDKTPRLSCRWRPKACSYVWESRFGSILVEVREGRAYVNGQAVEAAEYDAASTPRP